MANDKKEIETFIITTSGKQENLQKEELNKAKLTLEEKIAQHNKEVTDLTKKLETEIKIEGDKINKVDQ
jgi:hypothetical protein